MGWQSGHTQFRSWVLIDRSGQFWGLQSGHTRFRRRVSFWLGVSALREEPIDMNTYSRARQTTSAHTDGYVHTRINTCIRRTQLIYAHIYIYIYARAHTYTWLCALSLSVTSSFWSGTISWTTLFLLECIRGMPYNGLWSPPPLPQIKVLSHVCMYLRMYECMYVCTHVFTYACMCVRTPYSLLWSPSRLPQIKILSHVCMHVFVYSCICVCMYVCIYVCTP
jgi:hypothetical protein